MKMKKLIILTLILAIGLVHAFEYDEKELETEESMSGLYERWRSHHNMAKASHEEKHKQFKAFKSNLHHVHHTNKMNKPYKLRLNQFAGMSNEEFLSKHTGFKSIHHKIRQRQRNEVLPFRYADFNPPPAVDWRKEHAVTPIRTQGLCGGCWAFSAVDCIEGINQIKTKKLVALSPQQLVDCDPIDGGCDGGMMGVAFDFVAANGGMTTEENYPYVGINQTCNVAKLADHAVTIDGHEEVPPEDEDSMLKAVANQPVGVAVDAASRDFQFYSEGVFIGKCGIDVNHAVTLLGYDTSEDGKKYWILRTSWGDGWGEKGYMRILRGTADKKGLCGLAIYGAYPVKDSDKNPISSLTREEL